MSCITSALYKRGMNEFDMESIAPIPQAESANPERERKGDVSRIYFGRLLSFLFQY